MSFLSLLQSLIPSRSASNPSKPARPALAGAMLEKLEDRVLLSAVSPSMDKSAAKAYREMIMNAQAGQAVYMPLQDNQSSFSLLSAGDDLPVVLIRSQDAPAGEYRPGRNESAWFKVTRKGKSESLQVKLQVGGSATPIQDYTFSGIDSLDQVGQDWYVYVTVPAGDYTQQFHITAVDDAIVEEVETVELTIAASENYTIGRLSSASRRIFDNDYNIIDAAISFNSQGIAKDDGSGNYAGPHWLDKNGDGDVEDEGESKNPTSHVRGTPTSDSKVIATVDFNTEGDLKGEYQIKGVGTGPGSPVFEGKATIEGSHLKATLTPTQKLPDLIDFSNLNIAWTITRKQDGMEWGKNYGQSSNRIYVTGAAAANAFETVLYLGTNGGKGKTPDGQGGNDDKAIVDGIWAEFSDKVVNRVGEETGMKYWGPWASDNDNTQAAMTVAGLLKNGDGRCQAWAGLMRDAVKTTGVKIAQNASQAGFMLIRVRMFPKDGYDHEHLQSGIKMAATVSQGGNAGADFFDNHLLARFGTTIYDPSYGYKAAEQTLAASIIKWENDQFSATRYKPNAGGDPEEFPNTGAVDLDWIYAGQTQD